MSLRRCFLSIIVLSSVIQNVTASSLFGENSAFRKMHSFGHAIYQNRIPIGIGAATTTVLLTSYDKPAVITLALCNIFLLNEYMQLARTVNHLVATAQQSAEDLKGEVTILRNDTAKIKEDMNTLAGNVQEVNGKITPLNDNVLSLYERLEAARKESALARERIESLKVEFGIMNSGIETLNTKHDALSQLVITEATTTRERNDFNANRILSATAAIRISESSTANANRSMTHPPVSPLFNSPLALYARDRLRTNN